MGACEPSDDGGGGVPDPRAETTRVDEEDQQAAPAGVRECDWAVNVLESTLAHTPTPIRGLPAWSGSSDAALTVAFQSCPRHTAELRRVEGDWVLRVYAAWEQWDSTTTTTTVIQPAPAATPADADGHSSPPTVPSSPPPSDGRHIQCSGTVTRVIDGDTLAVAGCTNHIRLRLVDTPEIFGGAETCGEEAQEYMEDFILGEHVNVVGPAAVTYGRDVGEVIRARDDASANVWIYAQGFALIDERYANEDPDLTRRVRTSARYPHSECDLDIG